MEFWAILLLSVTFGTLLLYGIIQLIRSRTRVPDIPLEKNLTSVIVKVENQPLDHVQSYFDESALDEDEPLQNLAQNLSLKRSASVKYKDHQNIKKDSRKKPHDLYKPIDYGKFGKSMRYNTLPTPPSTPKWGKRQLSFVKTGSDTSVESNDQAIDSLEEKFSHSIEMIPQDGYSDRAAAVAFLKSKSQERSSELEIKFCTPPRYFL